MTLHRFERGETEIMGEGAIERVAQTLGLDFIDLMCATGRVPSDVIALLSTKPDDVRRYMAEAKEKSE